MSSFILFNGELCEESEISISPFNRGLMYGDGCFATFRSYKSRFLHFNKHIERLNEAQKYLRFSHQFEVDTIRTKIGELIHKSGLGIKDCIVRIQVWREGDRGYKTDSTASNWLVSVSELPEVKKNYSLIFSDTRAMPQASLNRSFKLSNGLNFIQAAAEASEQNADDALLLTMNGFVSETTISNIFWVNGDKFYTPSLQCDIYPGLTRELVIDLIRSSGFKLFEAECPADELLKTDAVFLTNSVREFITVHKINDSEFVTDHNLVKSIQSDFESYKAENLLS